MSEHTHIGPDGLEYSHSHEHKHQHTQTKAVLNRLSRAIGHLESVRKMVEDGRDCSEAVSYTHLDVYKRQAVKLMADLFHMSLEERDIPRSLRMIAKHLVHVHIADNTREAAGLGSTDFRAALRTLMDIGYCGSLTMEFMPVSYTHLPEGRGGRGRLHRVRDRHRGQLRRHHRQGRGLSEQIKRKSSRPRCV